MKQWVNDFKAFVNRGNVVDLAVGVTIGAAFGKIVSSLVNDLLMPILSLLTGGLNVTDLKIIFKAATETQKEVALNYGNFLQNILDFFIIAFSIFVIVKVFNRFRKKEEEKPKEDDQLSVLKDIRKLLKEKTKS